MNKRILLTLTTAVALVLLIGCASGRNYWKESGCEYKQVRHYDSNGHFAGSTWYTECKED